MCMDCRYAAAAGRCCCPSASISHIIASRAVRCKGFGRRSRWMGTVQGVAPKAVPRFLECTAPHMLTAASGSLCCCCCLLHVLLQTSTMALNFPCCSAIKLSVHAGSNGAPQPQTSRDTSPFTSACDFGVRDGKACSSACRGGGEEHSPRGAFFLLLLRLRRVLLCGSHDSTPKTFSGRVTTSAVATSQHAMFAGHTARILASNEDANAAGHSLAFRRQLSSTILL